MKGMKTLVVKELKKEKKNGRFKTPNPRAELGEEY